MLNLRLLQETIRENERLWLICTALLTAGMLVCEAVYGTDAGEKLWQFFSVIPGMTGEISQNDASLTGYLGSCMFGAWLSDDSGSLFGSGSGAHGGRKDGGWFLCGIGIDSWKSAQDLFYPGLLDGNKSSCHVRKYRDSWHFGRHCTGRL